MSKVAKTNRNSSTLDDGVYIYIVSNLGRADVFSHQKALRHAELEFCAIGTAGFKFMISRGNGVSDLGSAFNASFKPPHVQSHHHSSCNAFKRNRASWRSPLEVIKRNGLFRGSHFSRVGRQAKRGHHGQKYMGEHTETI